MTERIADQRPSVLYLDNDEKRRFQLFWQKCLTLKPRLTSAA